MWHSLHDEILTLPDDLAVYPTHGAGSFCSAPGATERTTTIGRERATNPLLASARRGHVRRRSSSRGFGSFPTYFSRLPEVNRRGPRLYGTLPALDRLDRRRRAASSSSDGALLVDVRPIADFAPVTSPGRCRSSCGRCSRAGSAGSSSPTGRSCSSRRRPGPRRARAPMPRRRLRAPRRRARRRHRRLARGRAARCDASSSSTPSSSTRHGRSTSASATSTRPATSPARVNIELGALADVADDLAGPDHRDVRSRRTRHDRRQHPRTTRPRTTSRVLAGGPTTGPTATGTPLEIDA